MGCGSVEKNLPANAGDVGSSPGLERPPGEGNGKPTPVFLPGKFHEQRSLAGYSPRGPKESDTTERLSTHAQSHPACGGDRVNCYHLHVDSKTSVGATLSMSSSSWTVPSPFTLSLRFCFLAVYPAEDTECSGRMASYCNSLCPYSHITALGCLLIELHFMLFAVFPLAWYRWILLALKKQRYMPDSGILIIHGASWALFQLCLQGWQSFFTVCLLVCLVSLSSHSGPGPAGFILCVVCHFSHLLLPNGRSSYIKCQQQLMVALYLCYLNCVLFFPSLSLFRCWIWDSRLICSGLCLRLQWILQRSKCKSCMQIRNPVFTRTLQWYQFNRF